MNELFGLVKRNVKIFLRDRASVFFSLLSAIVVLMVYILFLGPQTVRGVENQFPGVSGVSYLISSYLMSGIIVINSITVTLALFGNMIIDEQTKRIQGFLVTPINRFKLMLGYLMAAWAGGFILCMLTLVIAEGYVLTNGGSLLSLTGYLRIIGLTAFNVITTSSVMFFVISLIHSTGAFSTLSTITGTLIGFVCGIYVPISIMHPTIQTIAKLIPFTHNTVLMRQAYTEAARLEVFGNLLSNDFTRVYGVDDIELFGMTFGPLGMILYVLGSSVLFLLLSYLFMRNRKLT